MDLVSRVWWNIEGLVAYGCARRKSRELALLLLLRDIALDFLISLHNIRHPITSSKVKAPPLSWPGSSVSPRLPPPVPPPPPSPSSSSGCY